MMYQQETPAARLLFNSKNGFKWIVSVSPKNVSVSKDGIEVRVGERVLKFRNKDVVNVEYREDRAVIEANPTAETSFV